MKLNLIPVLVICALLGCDNSSSTVIAPPPANVTPRAGTGVAIVVDCSGSMGDPVKDQNGQNQKEAIAKRCVLNLLQHSQNYLQRNPAKILEVSVLQFDNNVTTVIPFGKPDVNASKSTVEKITPGGSTAIGRAVGEAKKALDATGLMDKHIILVTDGENTAGPSPETVAQSLRALPAEQRPSVYVVAFDVSSSVFKPLKDAGWVVLSASNGQELQQTLDQVLGENILLEK
jgi:Mg-chelatase subunit ChlD